MRYFILHHEEGDTVVASEREPKTCGADVSEIFTSISTVGSCGDDDIDSMMLYDFCELYLTINNREYDQVRKDFRGSR